MLNFVPDSLIVNAGSNTMIGMGYAGIGWTKRLHEKSADPTKPTLRDWLDYFNTKEPCRLHLHNPAGQSVDPGNTNEMWPDQISRAMARALTFDVKANPAEFALIRNRLNWLEMVDACDNFPYEICGYIGAPHKYPLIKGESDASWIARIFKEQAAFRRAFDVIGLDNTMGSRPAYFMNPRFCGSHGLVHDYFDKLWDTNSTVSEVTNYISDEWLSTAPKYLAEGFLRSMIAANPVGAKEWSNRLKVKIPGTEIFVDHEPLQAAGAKGETVWVQLDTKAGMLPQDFFDHCNKFKQDFPDFRTSVYWAHIPLSQYGV